MPTKTTRRKTVRTKPTKRKVVRTKRTKPSVQFVMESFREMFGGIPMADIMPIPCTGTVEERTGSENRLVDIIIYAQIPNIPWVHFSPHHPTFGTGVP